MSIVLIVIAVLLGGIALWLRRPAARKILLILGVAASAGALYLAVTEPGIAWDPRASLERAEAVLRDMRR